MTWGKVMGGNEGKLWRIRQKVEKVWKIGKYKG